MPAASKSRDGGAKAPRAPRASGPRASLRRGKGGPPLWPTFKAWLRAIGVGGALGSGLGVGVVLWLCYRSAEATVLAGLDGPVWTVPGQVWSGPVEVWEGLRASPELLSKTLVSAGYAVVPKASRPGDVALGEGSMVVVNRAAQGFSPQVDEVMITFKDGRVRSITPGDKVRFAPAKLATVRGADNENRSPVPLASMPKHLQQAVLATEDARFYDHPGLDALGLARALAVDLWHREMVQGGSTLTQQVAKNLFLTHDRTVSRKFQEMLMAVALERKLSKDDILALYLNEVYLGQGGGASLCGMDAAAKAWFGKSVDRVTLVEAATLAGAIASPNQWSPIKHPDAALGRRNVVLGRMVETGAITEAARIAAAAEPMVTAPSPSGRRAPWAVDTAIEHVEDQLGAGAIAERGLDVRTAIQPMVQALAEAAVAEGFAEVLKAHPKVAGAQVAAVVLRAGDGAVVAAVGGHDWASSPFNRAEDAVRELGSTIKPLTLLFAFEADSTLSPATVFDDAPLTRTHDGKTWSPANYDHSFVGPISLRRAIATSRNIPAVLLSERVGLANLKLRLRGLGLSLATDYPSAALGGFGATPVEIAGAYAIFAGDGAWRRPWLTEGAWAGDEQVVSTSFERGPAYGASARWLATDVMRSVMTEGTGKGASKYGVGRGAAGKSGTTDATKDAWFAGVAGGYSVVVWVGFDDGRPLGLTGSAAALPIWARLVNGLGVTTSVAGPPSGLVSVEVCVATGLPPCDTCEELRQDWFRTGAVPVVDCKAEAKQRGDKPGVFEALRDLFKPG